MATQSPFEMLDRLASSVVSAVAPPEWAVAELQRKMVLVLNHVLLQEPEAVSRLKRQSGRTILVQWRGLTLRLGVSPMGLLEIASATQSPDLTFQLTQDLIAEIAQTLLQGDKPAVRIEGDVQLAAEINWLVDNVRWDLEEDLARLIGDVPAHAMGQMAHRLVQALGQFLRMATPASRGTP